MVGAPDETIEMMNESLKMAQQSHADEIFFGLLYPLPGTEIRHYCEHEEMTNTIDVENIGPVFQTKYVSKPHLRRFMRKVKRWQIKMYIFDGVKLRGLHFFLDCFLFVFYYKTKYDFEVKEEVVDGKDCIRIAYLNDDENTRVDFVRSIRYEFEKSEFL